MWGGKRPGSGRNLIYGSKTKPIRVPEHLIDNVKAFILNKLPLPLYESHVSAGCPFPVEDQVQERLDLSQYLVKDHKSTFLVKASGDSMTGAGIFDGDLLIVDRTLPHLHSKIIVASIDGGLTVKRLMIEQGIQYLKAENQDYKDIEITEDSNLHIWGVVTKVIHPV
ncbi:MAG: translesion error-prone DNA polymerase V autoproteolytic subunit [Pseudomonadota bacterium]